MALRNSLLIVEDSLDDEEIALRAIKTCGIPCNVRVIRHGAEVLTLLSAEDALVPDLVVLDFHLPGFNGLEVLRQVRRMERFRHVPIVMVSSMASDSQISQCLELGVTSFVQKPMDPRAYEERVRLIVCYWLTVDQRPMIGG